MKFHELVVGQRFEFEGEIYIKTNNVVSHQEQGGKTRLIRRSAEVTPLGNTGPVAAATTEPKKELAQDFVLNTFDAFYSHCQKCVQDMAEKVDAQALAAAEQSLEQARQQFIDTIKSAG